MKKNKKVIEAKYNRVMYTRVKGYKESEIKKLIERNNIKDDYEVKETFVGKDVLIKIEYSPELKVPNVKITDEDLNDILTPKIDE